MNQRAAIIDLGSNTFHCIIVEWEGNAYRVLDRLQIPVKLGKGSFETRLIQPDRYNLGIASIIELRNLIDNYKVERLLAYATSVIRSTDNGEAFVREASELLKTPIHIIDGHKEAELIYEGVRKSIDLGDFNYLVMDIGGGSIEFIIANGKRILWSQSFEIGIARLLDRFNPKQPLRAEDIFMIEEFLEEQLSELFMYMQIFPTTTLIGASGSFESLAIIEEIMYKGASADFEFDISHEFNMDNLMDILSRLIGSPKDELASFKGLPPFRQEMIGITCGIIRYVVHRLNISSVIASDYSLKEGALFSIMDVEVQQWKLIN